MDNKNLSAEMSAAAAEAARVVGNVPEGTLGQRTPCGDWDLRTLLNHTILWTSYSAERRAHGESVAEDLMNKDFTADPGFREDYARQIGKAVDAWNNPEAWAGTRNVMGNATPAADVGAMLLMETALHGWDVARATGQAYACEPDILEAALKFLQMFASPDAPAGPEVTFGPARILLDEAPLLDRVVGMAGRDPG